MPMFRRAAIVAALALCTGWSCTRASLPVPAQCNPICMQACTGEGGDTGVRWAADPSKPDAWDDLGGDVVPALVGKLQICEARRLACEQCLRRLDKAGAIKLEKQ